MSENIATEDMVLEPSDPTVSCTILLLPTAQNKANISTGRIYVDGDQITVSAITVPTAGATTPDPGPYTVALNASATKVKCGGIAVLREGDISDEITANPQIPGSPPTPYPVVFTIKISAAGQLKVKGE